MQVQGWAYIVPLKKYTEMGAHCICYSGSWFFHLMHLLGSFLSVGIELPHSSEEPPINYSMKYGHSFYLTSPLLIVSSLCFLQLKSH